jgi:hypothetical protein
MIKAFFKPANHHLIIPQTFNLSKLKIKHSLHVGGQPNNEAC